MGEYIIKIELGSRKNFVEFISRPRPIQTGPRSKGERLKGSADVSIRGLKIRFYTAQYEVLITLLLVIIL